MCKSIIQGGHKVKNSFIKKSIFLICAILSYRCRWYTDKSSGNKSETDKSPRNFKKCQKTRSLKSDKSPVIDKNDKSPGHRENPGYLKKRQNPRFFKNTLKKVIEVRLARKNLLKVRLGLFLKKQKSGHYTSKIL